MAVSDDAALHQAASSVPDAAGAAVAAISTPALDAVFLRPQRTGVESAWYGHVPFAHWLVAACHPGVLVELGTHNGVSYSAFCEAMLRFDPGGRAYAIDTWTGDEHAGHYSDEVFRDLQRFHDERYSGFSELLRSSFEQALPYFAEGSVDLLHIDGMHAYEAVRADWESWRPKLSTSAVVLFHDTNVRERGFGVWKLWQELCEQYPHFEFLHGHGLGVLAVGPQAPAPVAALCTASDARMVGAIRERFALLGERWIEANQRRGNIDAQQRAEAALAGARAELAASEEAGAEARAERDRLKVSELRLTAALADADNLVATLTAQLADARSALQRKEQSTNERHTTELQQIRRSLAAQEAELAALRAHHHAVVSSPSWRATAPFRQFGQRFPSVAQQATRAASLGVAAVTGQLPRRLKLRRQVREDAQTLMSSPLFDRARYLARYPEVAQAGIDPLWHYIWTGASSGYDPHPLFDSRWYLLQTPQLRERRVNPLAHYLREGAAAGLDPHPLFDTAYYVQQEPDAAGNALMHFIETGAARASNPNPFFDVNGYWHDYVRDGDLTHDPLSHYIVIGAAQGYDPHALFDTDWYAATYPDSAGWNPLAHFLREGRKRGYAPCLLVAQRGEIPSALKFTDELEPLVSIIVPAYRRLFDTLRCLTSIMVNSGNAIPYEVIVADDCPTAPIAERLRAVPGLRVEQNAQNLGFLRSCNRAAELAGGRYLLFVNNDTCVHPNWLEPLVRLAEADARVGMVGAKLLNANGTVQEAGGIVHRNGWGFPYGKGDDPARPEYGFVREVDVVTGACMLIRVRAWQQLGGFDERYVPAYYEEFDFAFALREHGWLVMYQPASQVTHFDAASYGLAERDHRSSVNHAHFCLKWATALRQQPAPEAPLYLARERPRAFHILVVDDKVPEPDKHAGAVATFDWLRILRGMGYRVTFRPHDGRGSEPYTATLQQMSVEVLYGDIDMRSWLGENGRHLDWVWLARPGVAEPLLEAVREHAPGKLIYFTHDLHFLREQRRFELEGDIRHRDEARRLRRIEREIFRQARRVVTPSAEEVPVIRELAPGTDVRAIPLYTVSATPMTTSTAADFAERSVVLFVGGYDHPPNADAARWIADEIMPLVWDAKPDARLVLAGSNPPAEIRERAGARIKVTGWLPDLSSLYGRARLTMNALRYGAGVKGKIIASLAAGVPVVTTPIGREGLTLTQGETALVGTTAAELARHCVALLEDATLCARLANAGRRLVLTQFSEQALRQALSAVLERDICPVCGRVAVVETPLCDCDVCGAVGIERDLAEAVLTQYRAIGVTNLRDAAPLLGRARMPSGPLAEAFGNEETAPFDLLVTKDHLDWKEVRAGGRIVAPAAAAAQLPAGWAVRMPVNATVFEATSPVTPA